MNSSIGLRSSENLCNATVIGEDIALQELDSLAGTANFMEHAAQCFSFEAC